MRRNLTVTGNNLDELATMLTKELDNVKNTPKSAEITLLTAANTIVDFAGIGQLLNIVTNRFPELELEFGTGEHQYDDICLDIAWH
ncbi:hypothetical protein V6R21_15655 [Limibacter armeniacum]|uniref:hypothetical protein n=1 Tax=Limibacter armeniacum TaxID=466084 RepID=UPI002FE57B62